MIIRFLDELKTILETINHDFQIVIVDDGSTDDTRELLQSLDWQSKIKLNLVFLEPVSYTHLTLPTIYSV